MKLYGQLEYAQFEQIASASPTPAPSGRIYIDTTSPSAHVPKIRVNSTWKSFAFVDTTTGINVVTASSKTQVIDWSVAKTWIVKLANNVVFSFTNPIEDASLTLVVQQADLNSPSPYTFALNMAQNVPDGAIVTPRVPLASNGQRVFNWFYKTNSLTAGTALNKKSDIAPAWTVFTPGAATVATSVDIGTTRGDGAVMMVRAGGSNGGVNIEYLFGTVSNDKIAWSVTSTQTGPVAGNAADGRFSPDGSLIAIATASSPFVGAAIVPYSLKNPIGSVRNFTAPTALAGAANSLNWHPNQKYLGVGHATSPFLTILPTSNAAFSTKLADPSSLPVGASLSFRFAPSGDYFASLSNTSPYLEVWAFTSEAATPIGAKSSNPSTLPQAPYIGAATPSGLAWSPFANWIACSQNVSPYMFLAPFDRNTGAFGTPVTVAGITGPVRCISFSPDGLWLAVGNTTGCQVFPFNQSTGVLGTALTFQTSDAPATSIADVSWSHDGKWVTFTDSVAANFPYVFRLPAQQNKYYLVNKP